MHFASVFLSVAALCVISFIGALPFVRGLAAGSDSCQPDCLWTDEYRMIVTSGIQDGTPFKSDVVPGGGTASYTVSTGIAVTVTVGFELKLTFAKIWQAGVKSTVSYTTSKSSAGTGSMTCPPGPWHCALMIIPKIHTITGQVRYVGQRPHCGAPTPIDDGWKVFSLTAPDVDPNNVANLGIDMCTCKNMLDWADPGHLPQLCTWDC